MIFYNIFLITGLSILNTLVNYSRFIANEFYIGMVYINIQTRWIDPDICEEEGKICYYLMIYYYCVQNGTHINFFHHI